MSDYQKYKESHLKAQKKYDDKNREKKREYDKKRWQERKIKYQELENLKQENQELKKQLEENQNPLKGIFAQVNDDTLLRDCGNMNAEINELKNQQKEFIEYMNKTIIIEEKEDGEISLKASKGIKWSTFITGIEMLIEIIKKEVPINIDNILEDIKRIYERDNKAEKDNKNN